jgi:glycosyltransferase involved in cell wall biosynthesis
VRIAVLAHNLWTAGGLSVGLNVVQALKRVADKHEYMFTFPKRVGYETTETPSRSTVHYFERSARGMRQVVFNAFGLPRLIRASRPDVVWGLGNFGLARPGCAQAILCQDRTLVEHVPLMRAPSPVWAMYRLYGQRRLRRSLPATQLVFCPTQIMLDLFCAHYEFKGATAVLPGSVSTEVRDGSTERPAALASCAGRFLLLCPSRHYPHKNLESLIDLFRTHGEVLADVTIVTTVDGQQDAAARRFVRETQGADVRRHFLNVGSVPQSSVAGYFRHVHGLLLPTLCEAFSMSYVESMHFGRPVLTSDLDFARAVCGDAAEYFDPKNVDSIRDAILRVKNEPARAEALIERGRRRLAQAFPSWDDVVGTAVGRLERLALGEGR